MVQDLLGRTKGTTILLPFGLSREWYDAFVAMVVGDCVPY